MPLENGGTVQLHRFCDCNPSFTLISSVLVVALTMSGLKMYWLPRSASTVNETEAPGLTIGSKVALMASPTSTLFVVRERTRSQLTLRVLDRCTVVRRVSLGGTLPNTVPLTVMLIGFNREFTQMKFLTTRRGSGYAKNIVPRVH